MLVAPFTTHAQTGAKLTLRTLETDTFPVVGGFVQVQDAEGRFIPNLEAANFWVFEDGNPREVQRVRVTENAWRVAVAINSAEPFSIRDTQGFSRYDYSRESLEEWAAGLAGDETALLALSTPDGVASDFAEPEDWLEALTALEPDTEEIFPNLQALSTALQQTSQPTEDPNTASAILLVTSMPSPTAMETLPNLQDQALAAGVPVFIWLIDSSGRFNSDEALALQAMAEATGGQYYAFAEGEEFPDPDSYFDGMKSSYFFQYNSGIRDANEHEVTVQVAIEDSTLSSEPLSLRLDLQTPNPILVSPPAQIERSPSEEDVEVLTPFSQPIDILVEFPDDIERDLVRTTLYVNGEPVAENRSPPFTRFVWDLSPYGETQRVFLHVEAEDELGMMGESVELPVQISVVAAASGVQAMLSRNIPLITLIAALVAAGALFVLFVLSGRITPEALRLGAANQAAPEAPDPLTDSPLRRAEVGHPADMAQPRKAEPEPKDEQIIPPAPQLATVFLQAVDGAEGVPQVFPFAGYELLIGSDGEVCRLEVQDDSVEGQHTALRRQDDGSFVVADLGTEAGTWLNYAPVTKEGARVQPGDLIHVGRVAFRFQIEKPHTGARREVGR